MGSGGAGVKVGRGGLTKLGAITDRNTLLMDDVLEARLGVEAEGAAVQVNGVGSNETKSANGRLDGIACASGFEGGGTGMAKGLI